MWPFDLAFMLHCVQTDLNGAWAGARHQVWTGAASIYISLGAVYVMHLVTCATSLVKSTRCL